MKNFSEKSLYLVNISVRGINNNYDYTFSECFIAETMEQFQQAIRDYVEEYELGEIKPKYTNGDAYHHNSYYKNGRIKVEKSSFTDYTTKEK